MIGIWTDCRGCTITIIPNSWFFCLERVAWIHFCEIFWSSSSGTCALSRRSSNLFTLSCLGMIIFACTFPWSSMSSSTSTSCHSGNTLLHNETIQCHSTTSGQKLISHYNATTSPWDALLEKRLTMQDWSRRNKFDQTALQNQAQYSFKLLMTNCVIGVQLNSQEMVPSANASYLKVAKQMQAPRPVKKIVQDNSLKPRDRLWLEWLNYHNRVFSNEVGVFCQWQRKSLGNKEGWWEVCHFTSTQKTNVIIIASPAQAYLGKKAQ